MRGTEEEKEEREERRLREAVQIVRYGKTHSWCLPMLRGESPVCVSFTATWRLKNLCFIGENARKQNPSAMSKLQVVNQQYHLRWRKCNRTCEQLLKLQGKVIFISNLHVIWIGINNF